MSKIDSHLLDQIKTGDFHGESTTELYIRIKKDRILAEFDFNRIKKTTKVNSFNNRLYHIPSQLIENFNTSSYSAHQQHLYDLIQKQIDTIQGQETLEWKDKLSTRKLEQDMKAIDKDVKDLLSEYILDRIYHKSLPGIYKSFKKDRNRIIMISEELQRTSPLLRKIIDTIITDICRKFEIKLSIDYKTYNTSSLDKLLHDIGYSQEQIEKMPYSDKKQIQLLANKKIEQESMQVEYPFIIKEKK